MSGQLCRESMDYIASDNGVASYADRFRLRSLWYEIDDIIRHPNKVRKTPESEVNGEADS